MIGVKCYLGLIIVTFFLSGCMLVNPVKRMDLEEVSFKKPLPHVEKRVVVLLEEVVPGKPLNETVWDSSKGPYWDQDEAQQIGVTVSYRVDPVVMAGGATAATTAQGARWVVPFGPLFSYMMRSALQQHFADNMICYTHSCLQNAIASGHFDSFLRVQPKFKVWTTSPTSVTLNYSSDISFAAYSSGQFSRSGRSFLSKPDMHLNRFISYKAISQMRHFSKDFAEEVVSDVLIKAYPGHPTGTGL